jgi:molybdenum cofactor cytidylyltransferase
VTGDGAKAVEEAVRGLAVRCVRAEDFDRGMGRSLAAGLRHLDPACAGALVVLCDQPALTAEHLGRLVEAWQAAPDSAAASGYAGTVGVPALLPRAWFLRLASTRGDRGARDLLREAAGEVHIVRDERLAEDVDRPEEAAGLETRSRRS